MIRTAAAARPRLPKLALSGVGVLLAALCACSGGGGDANFSTKADQDNTISGSAAIELSDERIVFPDLEPAIGDTHVLEIRSTGDADLIVTAVIEEDQADVFFFLHADEADATVEPGELHELTLAILPESSQLYEGVLRLDTNDPDRPTLRLDLIGEPDDRDTGDSGSPP